VHLDRLIDGIDVLGPVAGADAVDVRAVTHDSRAVTQGALFCCVPGSVVDGHDYAPVAVDAGAVALLVERRLTLDVPQVRVASVRAAMPLVADRLFDHPSGAMAVVGVTGTNGKTTVAHLVAAVLRAHGWATSVIGTLSGARTTPEGPELQAALAAARDAGERAVAMEVSSHALVQHRVDGTEFAVGAFTNLSQDHLDYHATMDDYFLAKARLFDDGRCRAAVIDVDSDWGLRLASMVRVPVHRVTMDDAADLRLDRAASTFTWRGHHVTLHMSGRFNVANALVAATIASVLGVPDATIAEGLSSFDGVPGRFELVDAGQPFTVVVDYAHTPDGLEQVLSAARELVADDRGRVLVVFGCGGDRDRAKRPLMGSIATRLADRAYLTSDNPRSEDPLAIIAEVQAGTADEDRRDRLVVEPDRAHAMELALKDARSGDIVVVAGKGHESGQDVGGIVSPFDDRAVARQLLETR